MLLCDYQNFLKSGVKTKVKNAAKEALSKIPAPLSTYCKIFYFLRPSEEKRKIYLICPESLVSSDVILDNYKKFITLYFKSVRSKIEIIKKSIP